MVLRPAEAREYAPQQLLRPGSLAEVFEQVGHILRPQSRFQSLRHQRPCLGPDYAKIKTWDNYFYPVLLSQRNCLLALSGDDTDQGFTFFGFQYGGH